MRRAISSIIQTEPVALVDKSWGVAPTAGFRVRTNESIDDRAAARAKAREERASERLTAMEQRRQERASRREDEGRAREQERATRRDAERAAASEDPHAAAQHRRGSGRKDVVREQRDTRGYTTIMDVGRMRTLAQRGASVAGLAGAFGISEAEVERALTGEG